MKYLTEEWLAEYIENGVHVVKSLYGFAAGIFPVQQEIHDVIGLL